MQDFLTDILLPILEGSRCVICGILTSTKCNAEDSVCPAHSPTVSQEEHFLARASLTVQERFFSRRLLVEDYKPRTRTWSRTRAWLSDPEQNRLRNYYLAKRQCIRSQYYLDDDIQTEFINSMHYQLS